MSSLLREVIPLALAAAISPVIFLLQLNTLTGKRPIVRGAALTAGAAIVLIVVSTIGVLVGDTGFFGRAGEVPSLGLPRNRPFRALLVSSSETTIHPIPVGLTESRDQRKGWLAWRSAVHL
jgi:hypothetical protein